MSHRELAEWEQIFRVKPPRERWADARHGRLSALIAAAHGVKGANPTDYIPEFGPEEIPDPKQRAAEMRRHVEATGGIVLG